MNREAEALGESIDRYVERWDSKIGNSGLSEPLKGAVLASIAFNEFYGLCVLVINVPSQQDLSHVDRTVFKREGSSTVAVDDPMQVSDLTKRFFSRSMAGSSA